MFKRVLLAFVLGSGVFLFAVNPVPYAFQNVQLGMNMSDLPAQDGKAFDLDDGIPFTPTTCLYNAGVGEPP